MRAIELDSLPAGHQHLGEYRVTPPGNQIVRDKNILVGAMLDGKDVVVKIGRSSWMSGQLIREGRNHEKAAEIAPDAVVPFEGYREFSLPISSTQELQDFPAIVTERIKKGDLAKKVRRRGTLTPNETVALLRKPGEALDRFAESDLVLIDVKPSNLLEEKGEALLSDFEYLVARGRTLNIVYGTPGFIPFEYAVTTTPQPSAHEWALAATACYLLTQRAPQRPARRDYEREIAIVDEKIYTRRLAKIIIPLRQPVRHVLWTGLKQMPGERFDTCTQFVDALDAAIVAPESTIIDLKRRRPLP